MFLLADLKDLSEDTGRLEEEIRDLYEQRARHQARVGNYQAHGRRLWLLGILASRIRRDRRPFGGLELSRRSLSVRPGATRISGRPERAAAVFCRTSVLMVREMAPALKGVAVR